jgi:transcription-repair coupling factor (superfamily II helicase)
MQRQSAFRELRQRLPARGAALRIGPLPGSSASLLVAALADAEPNRLWVLVAPGPAEAESITADLHALVGAERGAAYPQRQVLPYETDDHHLEINGLRIEALEAILAGRVGILVTTPRALQELDEIPTELTDLRVSLAIGQTLRLHDLAERLEELGFSRAPLVEAVGDYSLRGGILDLFGFGSPEPARIEFWGDEIVSIRHFDILDQRSTGEVSRIDLLPVALRDTTREDSPRRRRSLLDLIPADTVLLELDPGATTAEFQHTWAQVRNLHDAERRRGGDPERPEELFLPAAEAASRMDGFGRLALAPVGEAELRFQAREAEPIDRDMSRLTTLLHGSAASGEDTVILCDNTGQLERLDELLANGRGRPARTTLEIGTLARGFVLEGAEPPLRVLTDHEIFRRERRLRRGRHFRGAVALESLAQLKPGDYVVHLDHGIGRFQGLQQVRVLDEEIEALAIEYAGGEILRVPVYRLDLIERWIPDQGGEVTEPPRVHKIGGKTWKSLRAKTEKAIEAMAAELLQVYAARQTAEGRAFSADTRWQKEMESSFLYEDTPDQRQATADVKRDMESGRPMDRLICGDVGYGKTEIAIRAAFKAVQDGTQVAVLAPTTILAEQHLHTFRQRLADYPVRIESLSRFRTAKEQEALLLALAAGDVDILIGTHRILEPDVVFKDLGLLVVDEEQRFGVKHKERFKELKKSIDVLTLTATPIPRTLHLSITGLRDITQIQTPPRDRMPITTHVVPWIDEVVEDAIQRELDRGGQVYLVHNRVQTIDTIAERVRRIVPDATIDIAHGQMPPAHLDRVMSRFIEGQTQVLVTTAIIENGLDVPRANTLIVDRADLFGLAQLYQIRGRVGRSHHRAYCYLIAPERITDEAEKRLRVLEHLTELGSGYAIALKDLELRGAGNILGAEQSGFVHAVGIETYTRLLEDTIRRMRGEQIGEVFPAPEISLEGAAYLPDGYIPESSQKLHLYRRLSRLEEIEQVGALRAELRDRFGPPPPEVERLLATAALRLLGTRLGVERIIIRGDEARLNFRERVIPRLAALQGAFRDRQLEVEVRRAMPLSLLLRRYGAEPLAETLVHALQLLADGKARAA